MTTPDHVVTGDGQSEVTIDLTTPVTTGVTTPSPPLLTLRQVVEATGVSLSTLRRRLRDGAFPNAVQDDTGTYRVPVTDLLAAGFDLSTTAAEQRRDDRSGTGDHPRDQGGSHPVATPTKAPAAVDAELRRLQDELAEARSRAARAEAVAEERAAALARADRDAESLRLALRALTAAAEQRPAEHVVVHEQALAPQSAPQASPTPPTTPTTPAPAPTPRRRWWQRS